MKTKMITALLLGIFIITSCKKKSTNDPSSSSNPNTQNTTSIVEGRFLTGISINKGSANFNYVASAYFTEPSVSGSTKIDGDSVCLNGTWLHNQTATSFYKYNTWLLPSNNTTCPVNFGNPYYWNLTGNSKVPTTNFMASTQSPYLDDTYISATSVSKSAGITITHLPITATKVIYTISSGNGSGTIRATKTVIGNSTGVTFTSSDLSQLLTGNGSIRIEAYNEEIIVPNSATSFTFTNETDLTASSITISN